MISESKLGRWHSQHWQECGQCKCLFQLTLPNLAIVFDIVVLCLLLPHSADEGAGESSRAQRLLFCKWEELAGKWARIRGCGGDQNPAERPFPETRKARKPKFSACHFRWLHWLWAAAYPGSIGMWHKYSFPVCIPSPWLGKDLKEKGKRCIKCHPYCCHPSSFPAKESEVWT